MVDGVTNTDYLKWSQLDQLILSALNSSLLESVLAQVIECTSAHDIWKTLESMFTAQSSAHLMQTHLQLATLKKGPESVTNYYNKARTLAASLAAAGQPLSALNFLLIWFLAACSHTGFVDEGISHFNSMSKTFGIQPNIEHYGCMVDILGRAGRIAEVEELIQSMPMAPDHFVLGGLLGACRIHGNLEAAERAARKLIELDPKPWRNICASIKKIYSSSRKWEEAKKFRELKGERNIKKLSGCSLIEVDGVVHEFVKGDSTHPQSSLIYETLRGHDKQIKERGLVPSIWLSLIPSV
ncbi:putative pentatricopeptide repeat-containing protein At5g59200, chloroplastic [Carya illinoinensis]|uniref:putative pentatricopeptide repeat-containing protein At5g59200, chloroplastic n=1 Tax=Carya illinoinensis TaxID=32201 RepID=UPI001C728379|nr:putative pentatricopeptide repeat-containing protein At5g59200, chloroplastic [Carya illinoinensis]